MTLVQVISGGQTGVDVAALRAARVVGLHTGGWMPRGFRTLDGPRTSYMSIYGMREHRESSYPPRTAANVSMSGATLRLAADFDSAGERCTLLAIHKHKKPHLDVRVPLVGAGSRVPTYDYDMGEHAKDVERAAHVERVVRWLLAGDWPTVNVAGNSERTAPGIEEYAFHFLHDVFVRVLEYAGSNSPKREVSPW